LQDDVVHVFNTLVIKKILNSLNNLSYLQVMMLSMQRKYSIKLS